MTFGQRIAGVLRLDTAVFEEIEANSTVTGQAVAVVVAASIAAGLGAGAVSGPIEIARETLGALVGWIMWAAVTYVIGARLMPEPQTRTSMGELLRVIGFSYAPNFIAVLAVIPFLGWPVRVVVAFWLLAATVVAARQALDYQSTRRAFVVVLVGWLIFVIIGSLA
jgi:hypothetical protein